MSQTHLDNLAQLGDIADELGIPRKRLARWAEPHRKIDFPKVKRQMGKYRLYDKTEVKEWVYLWMKISKNLGNKNLPPGGKSTKETGGQK